MKIRAKYICCGVEMLFNPRENVVVNVFLFVYWFLSLKEVKLQMIDFSQDLLES